MSVAFACLLLITNQKQAGDLKPALNHDASLSRLRIGVPVITPLSLISLDNAMLSIVFN